MNNVTNSTNGAPLLDLVTLILFDTDLSSVAGFLDASDLSSLFCSLHSQILRLFSAFFYCMFSFQATPTWVFFVHSPFFLCWSVPFFLFFYTYPIYVLHYSKYIVIFWYSVSCHHYEISLFVGHSSINYKHFAPALFTSVLPSLFPLDTAGSLLWLC